VGTWCFNASYAAAPSGNYVSVPQQTGAECFTVTAATPGFTTTILPPADTAVGNTWGDTATVAGNSVGGPPTGTVNWTLCPVVAPATSCTGGTAIGSTTMSTASGVNSTFTLPNPQTPTAAGIYCFNASFFAATPGGNYADVPQQTGTECFTVTAPMFTVTKTVAGGNNRPVSPGAAVTYTIVIKNIGDGTGSAVVTDNIPSQLALTTAPSCAVSTPDICTVANPTGSTWTFSVTLAPSHAATATLSVAVAASATGTIVNTATITDGPCIPSDACSSSVSDPINAIAPVTPSTPPPNVPPAPVSPISPTQIPVTG
jgi:uncharacterized repeat protein (TIGR01451 family)